jgi:DNA repair protein RecO (recombination protein O)
VPIVITRAVVLQTYAFGDTSKILRLMTREYGPRSAIAKGALRPGSRFGGLIEPFAEGLATLYLREGRDLHTLSAFDLLRERQGLGGDLGRYTGASVLCEVVMRLAPEQRDDRLFAALVRGLDELLAAPEEGVEGRSLRAIWRLVAVLGFGPDLERCAECGRPLGAAEPARFDFEAGGLRCPTCGGDGPRLQPAEVTTLRRLLGRGEPPAHPGRRQRRLLADFIRYHLAEGAHLHSLPFLESGTGGM